MLSHSILRKAHSKNISKNAKFESCVILFKWQLLQTQNHRALLSKRTEAFGYDSMNVILRSAASRWQSCRWLSRLWVKASEFLAYQAVPTFHQTIRRRTDFPIGKTNRDVSGESWGYRHCAIVTDTYYSYFVRFCQIQLMNSNVFQELFLYIKPSLIVG